MWRGVCPRNNPSCTVQTPWSSPLSSAAETFDWKPVPAESWPLVFLFTELILQPLWQPRERLQFRFLFFFLIHIALMWIYFFHSFLAEFKTIFSCPIPELVNTYPPYLQNWLTYLLTHPTYITDLPTCTTFLTYSHRPHTWPCIQLQTCRQTDKQSDKGGMENSRIWRSIFYPIEKIASQLIIWKRWSIADLEVTPLATVSCKSS